MQVGDIVDGRYRLLDLLGEGAAGKVFRCEDLGRNNMFVALKLLHAKDPRWEGFFRREFEVLSRLHHPNLVSVYDFGPAPEENTWYFTQELVVGKPLLETVAGKKIDEVVALFIEICRALEFIHGHGVLHRDLKPANILVQQHAPPGERVRVLDFGLWRELDPTPQRGARWAGTPPYLASEVLRGFGHSITADLYAVGVTLFQVLTRKLPHGRGTPPELLQARKTPAPDLSGMVKPEFAQLITRLLDEVPEQRPQSAAEVAAVLSQLIPNHAVAMPLALGRARLVGRDQERATLVAAIEAAKEKSFERPLLVVIEAPDGLGKSRFVQEVKAETQLRGGRSAIGLCLEDARVSYRPIADILRALAPLAGRVQLTQSEKSVLDRLLPEFSAQAAALNVQSDVALKSKPERARFHDAASELLISLGGPTVSVLIVEDIEHSDAASVALLSTLIKRAKESNALVVVTCGKGTPGRSAQVPQDLLDAAGPAIARVPLTPLSAADVQKLLCGLLGTATVPTALTDVVHSHARGSPLMVEELLALMIERGDLVRGEHGWDLDAFKAQTASPAVLNVLAERLKRLSAEEHAALSALAVFNRPSGPKLLAAIASLDAEVVREALVSCEAHGLVRVVGEDEGRPRYIFRHPNIKDEIVAGLEETGNLEDWHRTCAQSLEARAGDNVGPMAETLAHHFEMGEEYERALDLYLIASEHAVAAFAFDEAVDRARRASRLATRLDADVSVFVRCDLAIGRALLLAGHTADARAFLENASMREHAEQTPETYAELHTWLVRACSGMGLLDAGRRAVERGLTALEPLRRPEATARVLLARGELNRAVAPAQALRDAERAMAMWQRATDPTFLCRLHELVCAAALFDGDTDKSLAAAKDWVALSVKMSSVIEEIPARRHLAMAHAARAERLEARRQLNTALDLSMRVAHKTEEALVLKALGQELFVSGAFSEAIARFQNAATLTALTGQVADRAHALRGIGRSYLLKGEYDRALDHLRAALEAFDRQGDIGSAVSARCDVVMAYLTKNLVDDATATLDVAETKFFPSRGPSGDLPQNGYVHTRAELLCAKGAVLTARADFRGARRAFLMAAALNRRVHANVALGDVLVGYAQLLVRAGEPRRALRLAKRAESIFAAYDARGQLKRLGPLLNAAYGLSTRPRPKNVLR